MDEERRERVRYYIFAAFVGCLLLANWLGIWTSIFGLDTAILITILAGYKTFHNAISALLEKRISADIALCVAVIAALAVGQYLAAAEAMFIVLVGEGLESYAAGRTEAAIRRFVERMPRRARRVAGGEEEEVDAETLAPGDLIAVRAGEQIPGDGFIESGYSTVDESSVTGEPLARDKEAGDAVFAGSLNGAGLLLVRVSRAGSDTTLARVIRLVEDARQRPAPVEKLADRVAAWFLPALLLAAALTFAFTRDWLRTVSVLIVACPCALILATPTAMVAAIGGLARRGILVRGAAVMQRAARVNTFVFDKTGTITEGRFEIVGVIPAARHDEVIALAASAEQVSDHPIARIIVDAAGKIPVARRVPDRAEVIAGRGVECRLGDEIVRAGNAQFLAEAGVEGVEPVLAEADRIGATPVLIASGAELIGAILLRDTLREGLRDCTEALDALGITKRVILTGDRRRAAEAIAREAGIQSVKPELLPERKVEIVREMEASGRIVAMAGDGINDAPALAAATIGIAVAGASDITAEAADVVYLPHTLEKLPKLIEVSRRAVATAWQNIILFAGALNLAAVICAATGVFGPIGAALTHQLSSFFVMMNSLRLLRVERSESRIMAHWARTPIARAWNQTKALIESFDAALLWNRILERRAQLAKALLACAVALPVLNGFYIVRPDELAIVQRFGRKLQPYSAPGLHYKLPWPVDRLTRVKVHAVRSVEIGFRSTSSNPDAEPAAYEWNVQHRSGRFQRIPEESLMITGDQNMIELNATVHYDLRKPEDYLFVQANGDETVRATANSAIVSAVAAMPLDSVLTTGRTEVQRRVAADLQARLDRYSAGVRVIGVHLEDVHPSLEVVDAFREVSGAYEEKNRMVNEAEGYRNEQIATARGNAKARLANANAYALGRMNRAQGDAGRFDARAEAWKAAPGPTETRLYLETMDEVLAGRRKLIVDRSAGARRLFLMEDGVEIGGPMMNPLLERK